MKRFKEKTIIVTGADSKVGRATAIRFAHEGANVVLVGCSAHALKKTAKKFPLDRTWIHTDNYLSITCDISIQNQVQAMVEKAIEKFGKIDVVVNNTSKTIQGETIESSTENNRTAIDVHLNGTFYVCQTTLPHLIATKGNIVNVSALSERNDDDWDMATYHAEKNSVLDLTRSLALNHGADGVRVNAVNPSINKISTCDTIADHHNKSNQHLAPCPLGRMTTPDDIAAAVTFLASDDAAMITGIHLAVDGGMSAFNEQTLV